MAHLRRHTRRFSALVVLAALLFTHSALAVAACIEHLQAGHGHHVAAVHEHGGQGGDAHHDHGPAHGHSLLCKAGCEDQVQSRHHMNAPALPAPVAQDAQPVPLPTFVRDGPPLRAERPKLVPPAAPPPLPLTILLSRFRN